MILRRVVIGLLIVVAVLCLLGLLTLWFLAGTESGTTWVISTVIRYAPGDLVIERVQGRLLDGVQLTGVRYQAPDLTVSLERLVIEWRPYDLLLGILRMTRLQVRQGRITVGPGADGESGVSPPAISLPLGVSVDEIDVRDLTYIESRSDTPLVRLQRLTGRARFAGSRLYLDSLSLRTNRVDLKTSGWIEPRESYPLSLTVEWTVRAERRTVSGEGNLSGQLDRIQFTQELTEPSSLELEGAIDDPLADLRWQARASLIGVNPRQWGEDLPDLPVTGTVDASGDLEKGSAEGDLNLRAPMVGPVQARFSLEATRQWVDIGRLAMDWEQTGTRMTLSGRVDPIHPRATLTGRWTQLKEPWSGGTGVTSPEGRFVFEGEPGNYELGLEGVFVHRDIPRTRITLDGEGDREGLRLRQWSASVLEGNLSGQGRVNWGGDVTWETTIQANGLNPGGVSPRWPGRLALRGETSGQWSSGRLRTRVNIDHLEGRLRDQPIKGTIEATYDDGRIERAQLRIESEQAVVNARGRLADTWEAQWRLNVPSLRPWVEDVSGSIRAEGQLEGPRTVPRITSSVRGQSLSWRNNRLRELEGTIRVDLDRDQPSMLSLEARQLEILDRGMERLSVDAEGTLNDHRWSLAGRSGEHQLTASASGGLDGRTWEGTLVGAMVSLPRFGEWTLEGQPGLVLGRERSVLEPACLVSKSSRLCVQGRRTPERFEGSLKTEDLPLELAGPWLPASSRVEGTVDGTVSWEYRQESGWNASGQWTSQQGRWSYRTAEEQEVEIPYRDLRADLEWSPGSLRVGSSVDLLKMGSMQGTARVEDPGSDLPWRRKPLEADLRAEVRSLQLVELFTDRFQWEEGGVRADLAVRGSWENPRIRGNLKLEQSRVRVIPLGITLEQLEIAVRGGEDGVLTVQGQARSGSGSLTIEGDLRPGAERGMYASLRVTGDRFEIANTPEARVLASPDLNLRVERPRIVLKGRVTIPEARLSGGSPTGSQVVKPSEDVVIVRNGKPVNPPGSPNGSTSTNWILDSEVSVVLGDDVRVELANFSGQLTGEVTVNDRPDQPVTGQGTLTVVEGVYQAYGQKLTISDGKIQYVDRPLENPQLRMEAVRTIEDVVAGVRVRGTLEEPELTLFSEPPMPEADILSYLVLGRPASQAQAGGAQQLLLQAASTAGLKGGDFLAQQIGRRFGLDDVRVKSQGGFEESLLEIGKYLTPQLYVSYSLGLFDETSILKLRYKINQNWSIQAESGEGTGADLIFSIER